MHSPRCRYGRLKCRGNPVPAVVSSRRTRILQREVRTFSQQMRTVTGELERASETLELYRQAYPRDYRAASNLANVDSMLGHLYVRSERAGQRVMESVTRFITQRLKLKVKRGEGLANLLRLLRNAAGADISHRMGPIAITGGYVAAVENTAPSASCSITRSRSVDVKPAIRRLKRPSGEREVTHQLTAGRRYYAGTALEASDFPEPIAESQAAPLTSERKLKSSMNQNMTTGMKAVTFSVAHSTQREICRQIQRYRQVLVL